MDRLAEQIASALPFGAVLYVTADHGMVNVGPDDKVDADLTCRPLRGGVALLGGEPRARHVYARPGAAADVLATWREVLGERAWVASREEAIKRRLVRAARRGRRRDGARIGDVVAAATGTSAIVASQDRAAREPRSRHARLADRGRAAGPDARLRGAVSATPEGTALITVAELAGPPGPPRPPTPPTLLDVRWRLGGPPGIDLYQAGHIPGAVFTDLDRDLAAPPGPGGRHPMPAAAAFEAAMRRAGVRGDQPVVVYDDADSTAAARAWWLLRYFGHRQVRVLDGGFAAWKAAGHPVETGLPAAAPAAGDFTASPGHLALLDADGAAALARTGVLLDARAGGRYRGETEPVDPVAGHIPGAVSAPTAENVTADGTFRPPADLARRFAALGAADGDCRRRVLRLRRHRRPRGPRPHPRGHPRGPLHRLLVRMDHRPFPPGRHRPGPGLTLRSHRGSAHASPFHLGLLRHFTQVTEQRRAVQLSRASWRWRGACMASASTRSPLA